MKRTMLAALSIAMFTFAGTASAKAPTVEQTFKGSLKAKAAMTDLGVTKVSTTRMITTKLGRKDMLATAPIQLKHVLNTVRQTYRKRAALPSGWEVKGYAFINHTGKWTVTLKKGTTMQVIELSEAPRGGTNIQTWGWTFKAPAGHKF